MSEVNKLIREAIGNTIDRMVKIERNFYQKQIKGLILIMQQVEGGAFVSRKYVVEKLNMILNGGIGFHASIEEKLDEN